MRYTFNPGKDTTDNFFFFFLQASTYNVSYVFLILDQWVNISCVSTKILNHCRRKYWFESYLMLDKQIHTCTIIRTSSIRAWREIYSSVFSGSCFRNFDNFSRTCAKEGARNRTNRSKGRKWWFLFVQFLFQFLWFIKNSLSHTIPIIFLSSSLLAEFSTRMRRKRMRKMFAHALDRPVCHDGDSLHPSTPSFPSVSPSVSLFHDNSIPSLPSSSLSLFRTHARRWCLSSFSLSLSLLARWYLSPPLFDAATGIPVKTICQRTQDENVKPFLYFSTIEQHSTRNMDSFRY